MLIEPLASARYMDCGIRFHSNFTAAEFKNGHYTGQPKLFYADFRCYKKKARDVHCCIINSVKATFVCCEYCSPDLAHCDKRSTHVLSDYDRHLSPMTLKARKNEFCAKTALSFYNEKHGTEYELVKSLESNIVPVKFGKYQFSCNFKAKLEEPGGAGNASSKLFFGEMVMSTGRKDGECYVVDTAEGLDGHYYPNCEQ